ncbi:Sucrase/ferredoxin-like-domain-containing protein [Polychytrium aggregatum]|uniref:Sucrase/ferredoxin-like-domain-containing protein n=1 Tax=Polychytrium aggregatum TaxID=110093 RepID=UPI0022FDD9FF|nr:Sucrase/ferredoxin-like-domain-containing protein [Polychytrium aggregatum]KAI9203362.1 Sucrase/ferredoxin-like-domain-containing protein [Polychytrium aggregatum]
MSSSVQVAIAAEPEFTTDPCLTCDLPCRLHPQLPESLAKTISDEPMDGSVKPYKRHILIRTGKGTQWEERLEEVPDHLATLIQDAINAHRDSIGYRTIVTAVEESDDWHPEGTEGTDMIVLPDMLRVSDITTGNVHAITTELFKPTPAEEGSENAAVQHLQAKTKPLTHKAVVLVCVHKKRDKRCGVAGPMLIQEFQRVLASEGLTDDVLVLGASHFGGHKFAGNIIIYQNGTGIWYGRVNTCHVQNIVDKTIKEGKVFKELWRGQINGTDARKQQGWLGYGVGVLKNTIGGIFKS